MRTVLPSSAISSMRPSTARADSGSRPAVGSSSSSRSGSWSTARASARRARMPVEYPPTLRWRASAMPKRSAASAMRASTSRGSTWNSAAAYSQVVGAGEPVVERGAGRHHAAAPAHLGALGVDLGVEPERAHRAAVGVQRAGHEPHDRRLAGAVRAEQHGDRARAAPRTSGRRPRRRRRTRGGRP